MKKKKNGTAKPPAASPAALAAKARREAWSALTHKERLTRRVEQLGAAIARTGALADRSGSAEIAATTATLGLTIDRLAEQVESLPEDYRPVRAARGRSGLAPGDAVRFRPRFEARWRATFGDAPLPVADVLVGAKAVVLRTLGGSLLGISRQLLQRA